MAKPRLLRKIGQNGHLVCVEKKVCVEDSFSLLRKLSTGYPQPVDKVVDKLWITKKCNADGVSCRQKIKKMELFS